MGIPTPVGWMAFHTSVELISSTSRQNFCCDDGHDAHPPGSHPEFVGGDSRRYKGVVPQAHRTNGEHRRDGT